ncbi:hypothetical protein ABZT06_38735 [Streptomyces sp. NPDC005483]|uniref:hypothetical protein n=1 Tax=Streptomyces sp. NPDC005483 TaxID=3154882 RepID=UPI0033B620F3
MSGQPRPWRPEDFDDRCETCGAPAGQVCRSWCDTGYTAEDARRDAELRDQSATNLPPAHPTHSPKE